MDRSARVDTIRDIASRLEGLDDLGEFELILRQFGGSTPDWEFFTGSTYQAAVYGIEDLDDQTLVELHEYLGGQPGEEVTLAGGGPWPERRFKLFMGHISAHASIVGEVKTALDEYGIAGFVAHADIAPSLEWQTVIEVALASADAFVAFLHDGFKESDWTDQEVGYALRRKLLIVPLIFDLTPYGFMGRYQGVIRCSNRSASEIADYIFQAVISDDRTRAKAEEALITSFVESGSFDQANARSRRMHEHVSEWTPERVERIQQAADENGQISGAWHAMPRVESIVDEHGPSPPPPDMDDVPF